MSSSPPSSPCSPSSKWHRRRPSRLPGERAADGFAYALVVAGSVSLVWRRRAPIAVLAVVTAVLATFWLRGHGALLSVLGLPALYAVAAHAEHRRRAWWALGVACVVLLMLAASVSVLDRPDGFAYLRRSAWWPS